MGYLTANQAGKTYDAIVVGSGAAGGQAAYTLTMEGAKVLMLEAGRNYDPVAESPMFKLNATAPMRGAGTPDKPWGFYDATVDGGWTVPGEPYTSASDDPARRFTWWRARMLGGRTNHWGRIALRYGPYDFKPRARDGLGFDWPLGYEDLAPYYDKVEMLIGVYGDNHGLENTPDSPPGVLQPPPRMRAGEQLARQRAKKLGIPIIAAHRAVLTQRLDADRLPAKLHPGNPTARRILAAAMRERAACLWSTPCGRGCSVRATYQSTTVHLPPALATGNLDIVPNAMAREILVNAAGQAAGVVFIDKTTGLEHRATGRVVILGAGSAESVRILLNTKSARFPAGLANGSGLLGKFITDTVSARLGGQVPLLEDLPRHNEEGADGLHAYAPWWLYREQRAGKLDFPRGYHVEFLTGRRLPDAGFARGLEWLTGGSYGRKFKEDVRRYNGSLVEFYGRGEMIPNDDSYCDLDPVVKDRWGIPVLRFHWKWSDHELRQVRHMQQTFAQLFAELGGRVQHPPAADPRTVIQSGGSTKHEVGGAVMGADPAKSVTNPWSRTWEVPNLYIADGATFCSSPDKNPTLTIMAVAWRMADHILDELRKGDL